MVAAAVSTYKIPYGGSEVDLVAEVRGEGQPFLLLHGGAGPASVARFANLFAERHGAKVITPTHPGFGGTVRPDALTSVRGLAQVYAALLDQLGAGGVTVIGNSIGGWIAAELTLLATPRVSGLVLVDAVGIEVPGHPVADISKLNLDEVMRLSYHDPKPFRVDPASFTDGQRAIMGANRAALLLYAGKLGVDPSLSGRLAKVAVPSLVVWGDSDRIVDVEYGRAWTAAIPRARFELLTASGHVPQIETPEKLMDVIWGFAKAN